MQKYSLIFEQTSSDQTIPIYTGKNKKVSLHSKYNPLKEGERLFSQLSDNENRVIIVIGFGIGYHLVAAPFKKNDSIFIIEEKIINDQLEKNSVAKNERDRNIDIVKREFNGHFFNELSLMKLVRELSSVLNRSENKNAAVSINILPGYKQISPEFCQQTVKFLEKQLIQLVKDHAVMRKFGHQWNKNYNWVKSNINRYQLGVPDFNQKKVIITAAGPSLSQHSQYISQRQLEGTVILATDTSLPFLIKKRIKPDYVITIDAQHHSLRHYKNAGIENMDGITLIKDCFSASTIEPFFKDIHLILPPHPQFHPMQNNKSVDFSKLFYDTGGNVTHSAVSVSQQAGAESIEVMGADFGVYQNQPYCIGTAYYSYFQSKDSRLSPSESTFFQMINDKKTLALLKEYENGFLSKFVVQKENVGRYIIKKLNSIKPATFTLKEHETIKDLIKSINFPNY